VVCRDYVAFQSGPLCARAIRYPQGPTMSAPARIQFAWAIIVRGAAGIALAVVAFAMPVVTVTVLGTMVGTYALVDGAAAVAAARRAHGHDMSSSPFAVDGVLGLILGGAAFVAREQAPSLLAPLVAAWSIAAGVFRVTSAAHLHQPSHEWLIALSGALSVALGLVVVQYTDASPDRVVLALGCYAAVVGLMFAACGLRLRRATAAVTA
jgi:uncharacterized membrane protein HdeD (DUF308 family)